MIKNTTVNTSRDGVGTVLSNVRLHKTVDVLTDLPEGPALLCRFLFPVTRGAPLPDVQPGDYVSVVGSATQSAYKLLHVEDRSGSLIPELRCLARGTMQV